MSKRSRTAQRVCCLLVGILLTACAWLSQPRQALAQSVEPWTDLWFSLSMNPAVVDWFNEVARPQDIASAGLGYVDLLDQVHSGRRQAAFESVAEAQATTPGLADRIDLVYYDLGPWPEVSAEEQEELLATVRALQQLVQTYDLGLALGLDWRVASTSGSELAPYADLIILQAQRVQDDPSLVSELIVPLVQELREAEPDLELGVQLRMGDSLEVFAGALEALRGAVDGVSIGYTPVTVAQVRTLVETARSGQVAEGDALPPPGTQLPTPWFLATGAGATPSPAPQPRRDTAPPLFQCTWPTGLVLGAGGFVVARSRSHWRQRGERRDGRKQPH